MKSTPILTFVLGFALALPAYCQQTEAEQFIDSGHWKKARTIVESRIRQAPNDPLANFLLSQIHNAFGDYTSPLALAEKAVSLDGRVAKYHRQLAEVLGVEAQHASPFKLVFLAHRFRNEIDQAISLDPRDLQAQRDLLEYYLVAPGIAGGDVQKAALTAERIAELDSAEGFLAKARVASFRKQMADAEALLRQASQVRPANYRAHLELARFYMAPEHPNPAAAESAAKDLLKLDDNRVEPYAFLAQIYAERGDWTALDAILTAASDKSPDDLTPFYRAAEALLINGRDPVRAERYLHTYLDHEPEGNEPTLTEARRKLDLAVQANGKQRSPRAPNRPV